MKLFIENHVDIVERMKYLIHFLLFFLGGSIIAQTNQGTVVYDNVYVPFIKSVQFKKAGTVFGAPILDLGSRTQLHLSFDDIDPEEKSYVYYIYHCTKDWRVSELDEIEYLNGFNGEELRNFDFSTRTYSNYTNYRLSIPNQDVQWTKSGNYLLVIYEEFDDGIEPVIARRFIVVDNNVSIAARIINPQNVSKIKTHQEVDFTINYENYKIVDPLNEINVTILQNGRWDNAMTDIRPKFTNQDILQFNYVDQLSFPASKEFRNFDIRTLNTRTEHIHSIDLSNSGADVLLELAQPRRNNNYRFEPDANGRFFIYDRDSQRPNPDRPLEDYFQSNLSSDYANVIFTLESGPLLDEVYLVGQFSDWSAKPEYRLEYDERRRIYVGEARFKQGRYDYMFGVLKDNKLDLSVFEGDWFETENEYTILVYYRNFAGEYDQLIGITTINSNIR